MDGIFSQAQRSKEQTRIGELLDKFNISEAVVSAEKLGKPSLEDYIKQIQEKEKYIVEAEKQEDGSYNVISEDGYVFNVSIIEGTDTNDIVIEYIGQAGNLPPVVKVKNITTNSATIELSRTDGITSYKYEYKKHEDTEYIVATGTNNTCKLSNLTSNILYDVKVTVVKEGNPIVVETNFVVGKLPVGGVIKLKDVTWTSGKATATVYHEETGSYKIEWQKDGNTTWNSGEMNVKELAIPNLNHNDMIHLRLSDGISSGDDASMSIMDDKKPQIATISFTPETAPTGQNITATVIMTDNESGINNSASKYEFNKNSEPLGTEDVSLYTGSFASTTTPSIKANSAGTWYLHVLSVDNAGNMLETVKNITIESAKVSSITIAPASAEIEMGKTVTLTATVNPDYAEDKSVTWSSNAEGIATVDQTGKVKGIAVGTAVITATAKDGSGVATTCNITVKAPTPVTIGAEASDWELMDRIAAAIAKDTTVKASSTDAKGFTEKGEYYEIAVGQEFSVKYNGTALKVRVLGFKHDTLAEDTSYGNSGTKASISFEFIEFLGSTQKMNSTNTNETGWGGSEVRTYLNGSGSSIGGEGTNLSNKTVIKKVRKPYLLGNKSTTIQNSEDWLWLLSCAEIWNDPTTESGAGPGKANGYEGSQYKYYLDKVENSASSSNNEFLKKPIGGSVGNWWLRSPYYNSDSTFCNVNTDGNIAIRNVSNTSWVAPGFSI